MRTVVFTFLTLIFSLFSHAQFLNSQKDVVDVLRYKFHVEIADSTDYIIAKANENIFLKKKVDSIFLQLKNINETGKGMKVSSITNKFGKDLAYKHQNDKITIYNPGDWIANDVVNLEIHYAGIPEDGLYIKQSMYGKKTFFGDNWPNRAQYWLPVIDHPSDKAYVEFFVKAPTRYKVIASGDLVSKDTLKNSKYAYHFRTNQELPTKVMVLGAADFKVKMLDTINNIPVSSWIYKEAPDTGFGDYKPAVAVLKYFDSIIGTYPYGKLANVQSKTRFGGMENAGNIFYYEESVNGKHQVESLVAHEVAHQWFGNFVTEKNWRDIWLSEGFATYLTDLYLEHTYGKEKLKERMLMEREKVIRYAKNPNVQPIVYDEKDNLFKLLNRNSYEKGAWVLHMLRNKIGDKMFFDILKLFYETYRGKNAATEDFINIAEEVTKMDLKQFFDQWLYRADLPKIKVEWEIDEKHLKVSVQQLNKAYDLILPIKLYNANNAQIFKLHLDKEQQDFEFPVLFDGNVVKLQIDPEVQVLFEEE